MPNLAVQWEFYDSKQLAFLKATIAFATTAIATTATAALPVGHPPLLFPTIFP